ncbi:phosphatase PAP2 family protein [Leptolyngbya sp. FACHB-261]|uniref:phosphatase PAP2 family protein n=1 Tax=Leptolyngbya sp. FACHB-261 TaxID=2692806 RepID=UPI00168A044C|nr:phosphatase PAP2 family protein [Leptolyngbya sp. FACHB-261]MBD2104576.1 phosphatase PAP2 family protein [Leptolyngbya sp. FACHB-261]
MLGSHPWQLLQSFSGFLKRILAARWRSLLMLLIGVYVPLQAFQLLAVEIGKNEGGLPWDAPIMMAIHATAQAQLDTFAATLTHFGVFWGVFPVATVISLVLLRLRRWRALSYLLITLLGSVAINRTAKLWLHRVRPSLWEYPPVSDYAFPSGHAMSSMTLVAALVILTWRTRWCGWILFSGSLFVVAIGWTRLYLGVHYPSDILAGWMVSVAWAIGVCLLIRPHLSRVTPANDEQATTQQQS